MVRLSIGIEHIDDLIADLDQTQKLPDCLPVAAAVGAVVVAPDGEIVARAGNRTRELADPTAHAEMLAIRAACARLGQERLVGHDLYVTLEPCPMCAAAISFARSWISASEIITSPIT